MVATSLAGFRLSASRALFRSQAVLALIFIGLVQPTSTAAQEQSSPSLSAPPSKLCQIFAVEGAEGQPQELQARCGDRELFLGLATGFESFARDSLEAILIDARLGDNRRILLLTVQEEGPPQAEDVTGQIAFAAGIGQGAHVPATWIDLADQIAAKRRTVAAVEH